MPIVKLPNVAVSTMPALESTQADTPRSVPKSLPAAMEFIPPAYITNGLEMRRTDIIDGPREFAILVYSGDANGRRASLLAVYTPVKGLDMGDDGYRRYFVIGDRAKAATVGEKAAALVERVEVSDTSLVWENGTTLNHLLGNGLSQEELKRVAESIPESR